MGHYLVGAIIDRPDKTVPITFPHAVVQMGLHGTTNGRPYVMIYTFA